MEYLKPEEEDFLVFINNDTIVSSDFLDYLIDPFLNDTNCIITVPKILFAMDINKIWYAGGIVNMWKGSIEHIGIRNFDGPRYSFMMETGYATGCCLCINYADFKRLNYFDTTFNMYCEDVDLSIRARKMNRKIVYSPKSIILHSVSQSLGENSFKKIQNKLLGENSINSVLIQANDNIEECNSLSIQNDNQVYSLGYFNLDNDLYQQGKVEIITRYDNNTDTTKLTFFNESILIDTLIIN